MKSKKKYNVRLGKLLFILPALLIISIGTYAFIESNLPGTVSIIAYSHDAYENPNVSPMIQAPASMVIGPTTSSYTTPASVSVKANSYTVTYGALPGYTTPPAKTVILNSGQTVYAAGVYEAIPKTVLCSGQGFNETQVAAVHGVTPVIWMNPTSSSFVIIGETFGHIDLAAGGNYTVVFSSPGSYTYSNLAQNETGTVSVT